MAAGHLVVFLHVFAGSCFHIARGITVTINEDVTGTAGSNGTFLECNYSRENVRYFVQVQLQVKINNTYQTAVTFDVDYASYINPNLKYLHDRISFQNVTRAESRIKINFDELLCTDGRNYRCLVRYIQIDSTDDPGSAYSTDTNITVQVPPSVPPSTPSTIAIVRHDRKHDTNITITKYFTTTETNDRSHQSTSITATQQPNIRDALDNETYVEGDGITIVCAGYVGIPPENLTVRNSISNVSLKVDNTTEEEKNCSFYQNRSFSLNLTAEDNNAVFRCAVTSLIYAEGMFIETSPIVVHYPVSKPEITKGQQEVTNPFITLSCSSTGNPAPMYSWYWAKNISDPNQWDLYANTSNITFNITQEGIYRCDVNNTFNGGTYYENKTYKHTFSVITKQTTPIMYTPISPEKEKIENKNKIYYVIGGVGGGAIMIIILVVAIIKCRGKRTKAPTMHQKKSSSGDESGGFLVHQPSKRQITDANNYCSVSLDDGVGRGSNVEQGGSTHEETRKHNEKYLKEQNEKDSRNDDRGGHQPVEYAQVNKVQKTKQNKPPQDEGHYASGQGIYDHANDRRHKRTTESDPYDTPSNINRRRTDKVGSIVEITEEPIKQKQVAKVKPSGREGYENASMIPDDVIKKKEELNTEL